MKEYMLSIKNISYIEKEYANLSINFIGSSKLDLTCQNEDVAKKLFEYINHHAFSIMESVDATIIVDEYGNIINDNGKITKKSK